MGTPSWISALASDHLAIPLRLATPDPESTQLRLLASRTTLEAAARGIALACPHGCSQAHSELLQAIAAISRARHCAHRAYKAIQADSTP